MGTAQTPKYRYPGTQPFEARDYALFKGRDEDIKKLYDLVFVENLVVLFSRSGLGKSSLLNAGLSTKIINENRATPLFIRFGACTKETTLSPLEKLNEVINSETDQKQNALYEKLDHLVQTAQSSLWYKIKNIQFNDQKKNCIVLIFDQFEEIFSYPQPVINQFKKELSELLYTKVPQQLRNFINEKHETGSDYFSDEEADLIFANLDIRILFAIRSDKLSLLNSFTDYFSTILKNCYELNALNRDQATQAIVYPAQLADNNFASPPFSFTDDAINHILDSLTEANQPDNIGSAVEKSEIETFQLQIVCKHAENLVIEKKLKEIAKQDLGDIKQIFENQYRNIISRLPDGLQLVARKMIEERLIVEQTRVSMPIISLLSEYKKEGITTQLIDDLINSHLLRRDQSGSIEISHDTLVAPVLKAKKERDDKNERDRLEAERLEELRKQKAEKEIKELELAKTRRRLRTVYSLLAVAVIAVAVAGISWYIAEGEKEKAEKAKAEAIQLLDKFQMSESINVFNEVKNIANRADSLKKGYYSISIKMYEDARAILKTSFEKDSSNKRVKVIKDSFDVIVRDLYVNNIEIKKEE